MAFKELSSLDVEKVVTIGGKDKKTGKPTGPSSIEGYYKGKRKTEGGKYGPSLMYVFETDEGNIGVWGKTNLNNKMQSAVLGAMTRVSYTGMKPTKNGDMHTYKVEVDTDNTIEVSAQQEDSSADSGNISYEGDEESYLGEDEQEQEEVEEEEAPEPLPARASAPSAERQARVQALLKKKTKSA